MKHCTMRESKIRGIKLGLSCSQHLAVAVMSTRTPFSSPHSRFRVRFGADKVKELTKNPVAVAAAEAAAADAAAAAAPAEQWPGSTVPCLYGLA